MAEPRTRRPGAVRVDGVSKTFRVPRQSVHTLKERALHPFRRTPTQEFRALQDVSFDVAPGEFFGIVGRNGSGKSTLLKCLAGIYGTDSGRIFVDGRMSTFIELGVGFNNDLAAYDNVMINAAMLGLSQKEAKARFDRIMEFAELGEFVELKLKNYSSGMLVRLAFSVMIQVDADVLLIDEVLAVGDAAFQQKCYDEFGRIRRSGATVLLVTHDMGAVQRFCDRAVLLEHGRTVELGEVDRVAARYLELNFSRDARAEVARGHEPADGDRVIAGAGHESSVSGEHGVEERPGEHGMTMVRDGDRRAEITGTWVENTDGKIVDLVRTGEPCVLCFRVIAHESVADPLLGVTVFDAQDNALFIGNNQYLEPAGTLLPGVERVVRVRFTNYLRPDRYWLTSAIGPDLNGLRWHDRQHRAASFMVTGLRPNAGMAALPFELVVV